MRIVDIRETTVALKSSLRNAVFDFSEMTTSVVAVITDAVRDGKPVAGFAFNSTGRYACGAQMRARFIPRVMAAKPESLLNAAGDNLDPEKILACMMQREKPGGHTERSVAIGTIEVAVWDAVAKIAGKPLHRVLAERYNGGKSVGRVPCYVGGGWYQPGKGIPELLDEIRGRLDEGYTTMKIKVGGASIPEDVKRVEAALKVVASSQNLAVDANAGFDRNRALAYARALAPFKLRWFEEPTDPLDYALLADVARDYDAPLATGENLFSFDDARNLLRYGGLRPQRDFVQVDPLLAYGVTEYARILALYEAAGWQRASFLPHAGHLFAAHCVAGLGLGMAEAAPDAALAYGGYWDGVRVSGGRVTIPDAPGAGYERKANLHALLEKL